MEDYTPGFENLGLRIFQAELSQIEYLKGEQEVELGCCHSRLRPVCENFKALLMFQLPDEKSKAVEEMERVHDQFPNSLNILANLAYMYKERKKIEQEKKCKTKIDAIMKGDMSEIEIARSLAEQGYIMMIDLHSETREGPVKTLNSFAKQIQEHSDFSRLVIERDIYKDILKHVTAIRKRLHGLQTNCHRETTSEKIQAMKKLRHAIEILEKQSTGKESDDSPLIKEVMVWKHYLGKSYIRISGGSSEIASKIDKKVFIQQAVKSLVSSLRLETDTADKNELRIVARTYAYIAFVYIQKGHLIKNDDYLNNLEINGVKVVQEPLSVSKLAEKVNNRAELKDRVVLNKLGVIHEYKEDFDTAEEFFRQSITVVPNFNWFAYSYLCNLYLNKHVQSVNREQMKKKKPTKVASDLTMLKKAKEYGIKCLEMRKTSVTLFRVAKVCKYMGEFQEAIEYLQTALRSHECEKHPQIYAQLAHCWYETGDIKDAVHMMKIAITIEPKNLRDPLNFRDFLGYLLEGFRKEVKQPAGRQQENKGKTLKVICCLLEEGYRKHKNRIKFQLIGMINKYPHEFIEVLKEFLKQCPSERRAKLTEMCQKAFEKRTGRDVERRIVELKGDMDRFISEGFKKKSEAAEELVYDRQVSEETEVNRLQEEFPYDFYVLMTSTERAWVENIFLDVIEKDNSMTETILKGRIYHHRDSTKNVMKTCKKFVFVITEDFSADPRIERIAQEIVRQCVDQKKARVIPITREVNKIPDFLTTLNFCEADEIFKIKNSICGLPYTPVDIEENSDDNDEDDTPHDDIDENTDDTVPDCENDEDDTTDNTTVIQGNEDTDDTK